MAFDFSTLITDRTEADYRHWEELRDKGFHDMLPEEQAEWLSGKMKGAYNKGDLNRVGEALNYLRSRLEEAGYITYSTMFEVPENWTVSDIPTVDALKNYLRAVSIVRNAMAQFPNTPPAPPIQGALDYNEANNIEQILIDVETLINNMLAARVYCGEIFANER